MKLSKQQVGFRTSSCSVGDCWTKPPEVLRERISEAVEPNEIYYERRGTSSDEGSENWNNLEREIISFENVYYIKDMTQIKLYMHIHYAISEH